MTHLEMVRKILDDMQIDSEVRYYSDQDYNQRVVIRASAEVWEGGDGRVVFEFSNDGSMIHLGMVVDEAPEDDTLSDKNQ